MERRKSLEFLPSISLQEPPVTSRVLNITPSFTKRNSFRNKSFRAKNLFGKPKPEQVNFEIGKPFEFKLVTHVELDKKTKKLVGLPPEWSRILNINNPQIKEEVEDEILEPDIISK